MLNRTTLLVSAAYIFVASTPALAQGVEEGNAEAQPLGVEDIIVTAQKRSENAQTVPIAISAIGGDQLASRGVSEITQLANYTPSVQLTNSSQLVGSPASLSGFIRGIGQDDFAVQFEPGVGVYVDGVYLARTVGANANLLDVERVEILKGPQGTLFGRNTIGGAISVVTRDPANARSIRGEFTTGRFNRIDAGVAVDLPLIEDRLLSSFAVSTTNRDGYQKRIPYPGVQNFVTEGPTDYLPSGIITGISAGGRQGGGHQASVRGKLLWKGDGFRIGLTADYSKSNDDTQAVSLVRTSSNPGALSNLYNACISLPPAALAGAGLAPVCNSPRFGIGGVLGSVNVDSNPANDRLLFNDQFVTGNSDTSYASGNNYSRLRNYGLAATIDVEVTNDINLKSITAYRNQDWNIGIDGDGSPLAVFDVSVTQKQKQFSQELQLSGASFDDRLRWLVGAYYFDERASEQQNPIFGGGLFQVRNLASFSTKSYAAFTHLNFALSNQISFTAGARYTEERKTIDPGQEDIGLFLQKVAGLPSVLYPDPTDLTQLLPTARQKRRFNDFSPRLGVEFKPSRDIMIYGSYSRGYKSGGWTSRVTAPVLTVPKFEPESAQTYEVGVKSELFDRRIRVNLATFTTEYKNIQLNIQRGISPTFENAGTGRIKGVELDLQAVISNALRLNASAGYIDAHYTSVDDPAGIITLNSRLPRVPKWTAYFGPEYRININDGSELRLRADYFYRSSSASDPENTPELFSRAASTVDLSASYSINDGALSLTAGVKNVFDKRFIVNGTNQLGGFGFISAIYNRPAEWYTTLRFKL